jgi:hypothetical protein
LHFDPLLEFVATRFANLGFVVPKSLSGCVALVNYTINFS